VTEHPTIHVILPVHNRLEVTRGFIDCLVAQTDPHWRLVLVDDGCTDGTVAHVAERVKDLTVLKGDGNLWWAGALHEGYRFLKAHPPRDDDIVYINNDDALFDPDYFEKLVADPALTADSLVVSPGESLHDDYVERGFAIDWPHMGITRLKAGEAPDAITTRGLYMRYATFRRMGGFHPWLLPHYLSDLEYTHRAWRKGLTLRVSEATAIRVDRTTTGQHGDPSRTVGELLHNHFFSKKVTASTRYKGNFVLLAAPWRYKPRLFVDVYRIFFRKLRRALLGREITGSRPQPDKPQ
jgi:GT2 family glycosyltransferase